MMSNLSIKTKRNFNSLSYSFRIHYSFRDFYLQTNNIVGLYYLLKKVGIRFYKIEIVPLITDLYFVETF